MRSNSNMLHKDVVDYLATKKQVWKQGSLKSAAARLAYYQPNQAALAVYSNMEARGLSPYYRKITFVNLCAVQDWLVAQGRASTNQYKAFMQSNSQLFRNAYEDKYATFSWNDFLVEYAEQPCPQIKTALALMAYAGCRLSEIYTYDGNSVMGKGSKRRQVHLPKDVLATVVTIPPYTLRRKLKHNPHSYRKLAADKYLRGGIDIKTVQTLLGHSTLAATQRYLRPLEQDTLKKRLENIWTAQNLNT